MHTFLLQNGALWDMGLVHCGICEVSQLIRLPDIGTGNVHMKFETEVPKPTKVIPYTWTDGWKDKENTGKFVGQGYRNVCKNVLS